MKITDEDNKWFNDLRNNKPFIFEKFIQQSLNGDYQSKLCISKMVKDEMFTVAEMNTDWLTKEARDKRDEEFASKRSDENSILLPFHDWLRFRRIIRSM